MVTSASYFTESSEAGHIIVQHTVIRLKLKLPRRPIGRIWQFPQKSFCRVTVGGGIVRIRVVGEVVGVVVEVVVTRRWDVVQAADLLAVLIDRIRLLLLRWNSSAFRKILRDHSHIM